MAEATVAVSFYEEHFPHYASLCARQSIQVDARGNGMAAIIEAIPNYGVLSGRHYVVD